VARQTNAETTLGDPPVSLATPYDDANVFARILRGELPCHKVYEDDYALAFLDLFPQAPGHTLVIPKRAATNLLTFPADAFGPYMTAVQTVAKAVHAGLEAEGLSVLQFNGAAGGQTVFHLHFHIVPRHDGVPMRGHGAGVKADDVDLKRQAAAIIAALPG
jgi:histidine triad (HIT) family protein